MKPLAPIALMLLVFTIILLGVRKNDLNTQGQIKAQAEHAQVLAWNICIARNTGITASNARWQNEKAAWTVAAIARREQANTSTDPVEKRINNQAADTYQRVSDSIVPYPLTLCGDKP